MTLIVLTLIISRFFYKWIKKYRLIAPAAAIVVLLGFSSCTEDIDLDLESGQRRLVVDAVVKDKPGASYVRLSKSKASIYETEVEPVTGATVTIKTSSESLILTHSETEAGLYNFSDNFFGTVGTHYELVINNVDIDSDNTPEEYSASGTMPKELKIDSAGYVFARFPGGTTGFFVTCYAQEPEDRNYYIFKGYRNGVLCSDTIKEWELQEDSFYNGSYINGLTCVYFYDGKPDEKVNEGDTLTLQIDNINEDYFHYISDVKDSQRGNIPLFSGPPANVRTNLTNGAVGIFRVYSSAQASVIVKNAKRD